MSDIRNVRHGFGLLDCLDNSLGLQNLDKLWKGTYMHSLYFSADCEKTTEQTSVLTEAILVFEKTVAEYELETPTERRCFQ